MYRVTLFKNGNDKIGTVVQASYADQIIVDGQLGIGINVSDKFTFKLYPFAEIYNEIQGMVSTYRIDSEIDGRELSRGRILFAEEVYDDSGFLKNVTCAGVLDYLNDSKQPFQKTQNTTPAQDFKNLINIHNQQVSTAHQFKVGKIEITNSTDNVYHYVEPGAATLTTIMDKLVDRWGGELQVRYESDGRYLDWLKEIGQHSKQEINVNTNLQTMERKLDPSKVYSVFYPYGATVEQKNPENESGTDVASPRLTIGVVNGGKDYLERSDLIAKFGRISGTKNWDDVHDAGVLKTKATSDFNSYKPIAVGYQVTAIDLQPLGLEVDGFNVGDYNWLNNEFMGIYDELRIVTMTLKLDEPESSELTIGDKELTLAEYNGLQRKKTAQIDVLKARVISQAAQVTVLSTELATTTEQLGTIKNDVDQLKPTIERASLGAFGDSITLGAMIKHPYHYWAGIKLRYETVNNYGVAGTRIAKPDINGESMCTRFEQLPDDLNAVVGLFGTNDFGVTDGVPLGEFTSRDNTTFYGACHQLIKGLSLKFIGKPLLIVTPLPRAGQNIKNKAGFVLNDYVKALIEVCQFYSVNCLNLYDSIGINPDSDPSVITDWTRDGDGLHPNEKYHELLGKRIGNEMLMMI